MTSGTLIEPPAAPAISGIVAPRGEYRCECGHVLRVFGGGRHRLYFEPANARLDDPVMIGSCSSCGRGLPGKNPVVTVSHSEQARVPGTGRDRP